MIVAIIEKNKVVNVVAGEIEVVAKLFDNAVLETIDTGTAWIGARWSGEKFESTQPFDSWLWDEELFEWKAPIEKPEGDYIWSETNLEWLESSN